MNINSSSSSIDEAFYFIETRIRHRPKLVEFPDFLAPFNIITDGFKPGEVTVVKGIKTDEFFTSLLHDFVIKNNIFTYIISQKYSECFIGLNLLKYEMAKSNRNPSTLHSMYAGWYDQDDFENLKAEYEKNHKTLPFVTSRFFEYNIEEICESIRNFIQAYIQNDDSKRIVILSDIAFEDLKQIKTLAEVFNFPVIVLMPDEQKHSPYTDCEINIKKTTYLTELSVNIKNFVTLQEGEGDVNFDKSLMAFIAGKENCENTDAITQDEINELLK
ncbi:MAG: hypothetical protein MJ176_06785 [Treponema sp.]|nr:hypothetical protein [Treponema sp.]